MTREQLHIAFKVAMDKNAGDIAFGSYPAFLPEEIDFWLNQAMYQLVSNKFTGQNTLQTSFEKSVKRIHDLEGLIITQKGMNTIPDATTNACVLRDVFKDKLYFVEAVLRFGGNVANVELVEHANAKLFRQTYDNLPYIQTPVATIENDDLIIYYDPVAMESSGYLVDLTYVKKPTKVEDLPSQGMTEFPEYMQYEIVQTATLLALENIESPRTQTKSNLNQILE